MFSVTIAFGTQSWRLLFKTREKAEACYEASTNPVDKTQHFSGSDNINFTDDFGQRTSFVRAAVIGAMLEDMDESKLGAIEYGLHQQRTQVGFQQRAEGDPTLRAAQSSRTPILTPMGNGRFNS